MLALGRFLREQAAQSPSNGDDLDSLVEQLVQRVTEAVLIADRRNALSDLRDLLTGSAKAQLSFGAVGFPTMLQVIRDRDDLEMVQLALESLAAAVGSNDAGGGNQAAAINAQQLARTAEGLTLLLSLLEQEPAGIPDFYARYHALQVFKGLVAAAPHVLQEAILGAPLGVARLMDLLGEQEVLRNEALLLLTQLVAGSADLQKIAVFQGAFERLFGIIREEGGLDGDIVVQDCFQLLAALLRGSPQNQLMFRETGFLGQLPALLRLPEGGGSGPGARSGSGSGGSLGRPSLDGGEELPPQKAANLVAGLEVVLALLPPPAADPAALLCSSQAENRQALLQRGMLDVLLGLAMQAGGAADDGVRAQALLCLAALIGGSRLQQDQLAAVSVKPALPGGEPTPLLQAVLQAAVLARSPPEQVAADRLLEAYCCGNAAGQSVLAGSLMHASPAAPASFGGFLVLSLGRQGGLQELAASARAAAALSHLVASNPGLQLHLLALQVPLHQHRPPSAGGNHSQHVSLAGLCASHLAALVTQHGRQAVSVRAVADTLRLLLPWLHSCPPGVTAFLRAVAQSQPFLVDSIRGSNACSACASSAHPLTRGMLALLLGVCACYAEQGAGTPTQQQLLDAIAKQIGQQQFVGFLDAVAQVAGAAAKGQPAACSIFADGPTLSPAFAAFMLPLVAEVRQRVMGGPGGPSPLPPIPPAQVQQTQQPPQHAQQQQPHLQAPQPPTSAAPPAAGGRAAAAAGGPQAPWTAPQAQAAAPLAAPASPAAAPPAAPPAARLQPAPASQTVGPPPTRHPTTSAQQQQPLAPGAGSRAGTPTHAAAPAAAPPLATNAVDSAQRLQQALSTSDALQRENQQLRADNAALAERLHAATASSGLSSSAAQAQAQAQAAAAEAAGLAAEVAAARQQLAAVEQQLAAAQQQLAEAQMEAQRGRADAHAAQAAARKLETDLEDLSAAYSNLDAHAGGLQQQVDRLQRDLAEAEERQRRQQEQLAAATATAAAAEAAAVDAAAGGGGGLTEADVEQRVEAARQEAQQEADDAMTDLLVCLGQEEAKVARLRERLEGFGVDCDALLADIVAAGEVDIT